MQQKQTTLQEYQHEINLMVEYINNHLDEKIDLEKLASMSHFSPFHFHRIVKAFLGEPIGAFIIRLRVETAAKLLRYTNLSVQEIAYNVGYETPSSLSNAFKQFYNISPKEFRNNKNFVIMKPTHVSLNLNIVAELENIAPKRVIYIHFTGDYKNNNYTLAWQKLYQFANANNLGIRKDFICIYHDDPKITEPDKQRTDVCLGVNEDVKAKGEIGAKVIDGGKYIRYRYTGPYTNLSEVYDTIYAKMFPESEYQMASKPGFEEYINDPTITKPEDLITDIYVPVIG